MPNSQPYLLFFFVLGIFIGDILHLTVSPWLWLAAVTVAVVICFIFRKTDTMVSSLALFTATIFIGAADIASSWSLSERELPQKAVNYQAAIISTPTRTANGRYWRCDIVTTNLPNTYKLKATFQSLPIQPDAKTRGLQITSRWQMPADYPGQSFSYADYLRRHDYAGTTFIPDGDFRPIAECTYYTWFEKAKTETLIMFSRLQASLVNTLLPRTSDTTTASPYTAGQDRAEALIAAMTIGDRSRIDKEQRDDYSAAGAAHILALSGMHASIFVMLITFLLMPFGRNFQRAITFIFIWTFVFIAGCPISLIRVAVMLSILILRQTAGVTYHGMHALLFAFFIILLFSPQSLFDVGFQLSFTAVFFILLTLRLLETLRSPQGKKKRTIAGKLRHKAATLIAVTMSAQLGTTPLVLYHFGYFPTYFLLTNIIVGALATMLLAMSLLTLMISAIVTAINGNPTECVGIPVRLAAEMMDDTIHHIASLPHAQLHWDINFVRCLLLYTIILSSYYALNAACRTYTAGRK
ncbi:MAG: ComEC/Rec2 family competence protein [Bacteroidaceae bacterium]|nr:ComEC/Rec2 family competence protein [Bacteroidaceae bacterium]